MGETIDGRSFSAPEDYDNPWVIPERGILELRYFSTPLPPSLDDVISENRIGEIISHVTSSAGIENSSIASNDKGTRDLLLSHSKEHIFTSKQVQRDVNCILSSSLPPSPPPLSPPLLLPPPLPSPPPPADAGASSHAGSRSSQNDFYSYGARGACN